ncbi:hypothetical protein CDAR_519791 [Caerostris darwini]|uniref:Gustatory receptor n=1 Tax=Caerostris darwini TaxID=1538125 RepID=A0AAV4TG00_9ARAC|nr:hypothetical protein CDAR_519791 [Caerostris darwini]
MLRRSVDPETNGVVRYLFRITEQQNVDIASEYLPPRQGRQNVLYFYEKLLLLIGIKGFDSLAAKIRCVLFYAIVYSAYVLKISVQNFTRKSSPFHTFLVLISEIFLPILLWRSLLKKSFDRDFCTDVEDRRVPIKSWKHYIVHLIVFVVILSTVIREIFKTEDDRDWMTYFFSIGPDSSLFVTISKFALNCLTTFVPKSIYFTTGTLFVVEAFYKCDYLIFLIKKWEMECPTPNEAVDECQIMIEELNDLSWEIFIVLLQCWIEFFTSINALTDQPANLSNMCVEWILLYALIIKASDDMLIQVLPFQKKIAKDVERIANIRRREMREKETEIPILKAWLLQLDSKLAFNTVIFLVPFSVVLYLSKWYP